MVKQKLHQIAFEIGREFVECVAKAFSSLTGDAAGILQTLFGAICHGILPLLSRESDPISTTFQAVRLR